VSGECVQLGSPVDGQWTDYPLDVRPGTQSVQPVLVKRQQTKRKKNVSNNIGCGCGGTNEGSQVVLSECRVVKFSPCISLESGQAVKRDRDRRTVEHAAG
jgi:hypothetical protein